MRYRGELNRFTLIRYHQKAQALIPGLAMPSEEQEEANPSAADQVYESIVLLLRARTRDQTKFPLVHIENCNYGFRRNLWAMKFFGIVASAIGLVLVASLLLTQPPLKIDEQWPTCLAAFTVDALFLTAWIRWITPDWVKTAADAYGKRLLESLDIIDA